MRLAILHDFLHQKGGAERFLSAVTRLYPQAPVFTLIHDKEKINFIPNVRLIGAVKHLPFKEHYKFYLPILPILIDSIKLKGFDVVLSDSYAWVKSIDANGACHICYCQTPMRFAYDMQDVYLKDYGPAMKVALKILLQALKKWDISRCKRVEYFIANSFNVAERIKRFYRREATVIYPPCDLDYFRPGSHGADFFLIVSRLVPYKRIDIAVQAFNRLGLPLKIVGGGPQDKFLRSIAKPNIEFLGLQDNDEIIRDYYQRCRAFISCGEEDFGLAMVEVQATGAPVISFKKGGALEIIREPQTGLFFTQQSADSLIGAIRLFENMHFDQELIRLNANRFSKDLFEEKIQDFIHKKYAEFSSKKKL